MANPSLNPLEWVRKRLEEDGEDLVREMLHVFAQALLSADADAACGASYGSRSPERANRRNGYRERPWDTRVGTIPLAIPKLREGTYFPEWLLEPRCRSTPTCEHFADGGPSSSAASMKSIPWSVCGAGRGCASSRSSPSRE